MPTIKQTRAVKETLNNIARKKPLTKGEILDKAGYGKVIQSQPKQVFESKGFTELLNENISDTKIVNKINYLLRKDKKEETQVKALDILLKIKGLYAPDKHITFSVEDIMLRVIDERRNTKKDKGNV